MKHGKKYIESKKLVDKTKLYDLEEACGCKIKYVSVGAERDAYIEMY